MKKSGFRKIKMRAAAVLAGAAALSAGVWLPGTPAHLGRASVVLASEFTSVNDEAGSAGSIIGEVAEPDAQLVEQDPVMDFDYTGQIDVVNGEPVETYDNGTSTTAVVQLADGGAYDRRTHTFVYTPSGSSYSVYSSVANDIITTDPVSIRAEDGLDVVLYKQSKVQSDVSLSRITEPGKYTLVAKGADADHQLLAFRIVPQITGALDTYTVPSSFTVSSVEKDGEAFAEFSRSEVDLSEEGFYRITFVCPLTGVDYQIGLTIDHTPPAFTLTGLKEDNVARGPVQLLDVAKDETVRVVYDGNEINLSSDAVFRDVGNYVVTVTDPAGNQTAESFTIEMYLNYQGVIFFILTVVIIAAAVTFMKLSKKRLRVR